jgi:hypothetical protein
MDGGDIDRGVATDLPAKGIFIMMNKPRACVILTVCALVLGGCGQRDATPSEPQATSQATVPPPPGDSTPKAVDSGTRTAVETNEKPAAQSTVGTAASGAPPYTLNGAPEGNPAPSKGSGANEPEKK